MNDGTLSYPPIEEKGDLKLDVGKGMSFELRYVDIISVWGIFYIHNLPGTSRFLIQVVKTQKVRLTTPR